MWWAVATPVLLWLAVFSGRSCCATWRLPENRRTAVVWAPARWA
jgi:hypothetical protein